MAAISRRSVLRAGVSTSVLAILPVGLAQRAFAATSSIPRRDAFAKCLGQTFRMTATGVSVDVMLTEVTDLRPALVTNDQKRFSLIFRMPSSGLPPEGIYTFRQTKIGSTQLFVAPIDRGIKGSYYQAVINRLT